MGGQGNDVLLRRLTHFAYTDWRRDRARTNKLKESTPEIFQSRPARHTLKKDANGGPVLGY